MAEGIVNLEATIERLHAATEEAREATREAHSAIKALRQVERDIKATAEDQRLAAMTMVKDTLNEAVEEAMKQLKEATGKAVEHSLRRADAIFTKQTNLALYGNAEGRGVSVIDRIGQQLAQGERALGAMHNGLPRLLPQMPEPKRQRDDP